MRNITLLGATGSIGESTLSVVSHNIDKYNIFALSAHRNVPSMLALCQKWQPRFAVMADEQSATQLAQQLKKTGCATEVLAGESGLVSISNDPECDIVVAGIVGAAGLSPALAAAFAGKRICLANKEALVMAGALFMQAVKQGGATLIPVDSEHNALWQAMPPGYQAGDIPDGVCRLILTASGGPFRDTPLSEMANITPAQAIKHPNWSMGPKISVDSATMMNKGLEVVEAHWLFSMPTEKISVVIHPESIVHSLVAYHDGSQVAQLGLPDMRTPIACALSWPERITSGVPLLDLTQIGSLHFRLPEPERFPCLAIAMDAINAGGAATAVLNAANEIAVAAFLAEKIRYAQIPEVLDKVLTAMGTQSANSIESLCQIDAQARILASSYCR